MFKNVKNWWNKEKIELEKKLAESQVELETTKGTLEGTQAALEGIKLVLEETKAELEEIKAKDPHKDTTPWFNLTSNTLDPVKGLEINMDWNEAFVQHLRENGHKGKDEEIIVQKWLAMLYEDIITQLEAKIIDLKDGRTESDFQ